MHSLKLITARGLPGAGKSTRVETFKKMHLDRGHIVHVFSTDDFWGSPYNFVQAKLREAHLWNQNRAMMAMIEAHASVTLMPDTKHVVIIDNTNVQAWELRPYIKPAHMLGFEIEIIEPNTSWAFDAEECAKRNVHGVPLETIKGMLLRWDYNVTVEKCLNSKAPWEKAA